MLVLKLDTLLENETEGILSEEREKAEEIEIVMKQSSDKIAEVD